MLVSHSECFQSLEFAHWVFRVIAMVRWRANVQDRGCLSIALPKAACGRKNN